MSKELCLKTIENFRDFHFLVKDYQRGYKWTEVEVNQLLNDIDEFSIARRFLLSATYCYKSR